MIRSRSLVSDIASRDGVEVRLVFAAELGATCNGRKVGNSTARRLRRDKSRIRLDGGWCRRTPAFTPSNVSAVIKDDARHLLRTALDRSAGQQGRDLAMVPSDRPRICRARSARQDAKGAQRERDLKAREQPQIIVRQRPTPQLRGLEAIGKLWIGLNCVERIVRAGGHDRDRQLLA